MEQRHLPLNISTVADEDAPYIEKDLDVRRLSSKVRDLVDYWLVVQNDPNVLERERLEVSRLDEVAGKLWQITDARRCYQKMDSGDYRVSLNCNALDMTMLLQTRNFVLTLKDLIMLNEDRKTWAPGSDIKPQSLLFSDSNAGIHFPARHAEKYRSTGKITEIYKDLGCWGLYGQRTDHSIYNYTLDFRGILEKIVNRSPVRQMIILNESNALSERTIPNVNYAITRYQDIARTKTYDVTYHHGAEEALRKGIALALGQRARGGNLMIGNRLPDPN
ncbi:MAG: hypothetical protein PHZ00_03970 [Candidatus Peribacteraceae bacterium]|nr:hypothetical protein [Candidatus Peribacteraceae bacterium]